jgi:hypothetical protein
VNDNKHISKRENQLYINNKLKKKENSKISNSLTLLNYRKAYEASQKKEIYDLKQRLNLVLKDHPDAGFSHFEIAKHKKKLSGIYGGFLSKGLLEKAKSNLIHKETQTKHFIEPENKIQTSWAANRKADAIAVATGVVLPVGNDEGIDDSKEQPRLLDIKAVLHRGSGFGLSISGDIYDNLLENHANKIKEIVHEEFKTLNIDHSKIGHIYVSIKINPHDGTGIEIGDSYFFAAAIAVIAVIKGWQIPLKQVFIGAPGYSDNLLYKKLQFLVRHKDISKAYICGEKNLQNQIGEFKQKGLAIEAVEHWSNGLYKIFPNILTKREKTSDFFTFAGIFCFILLCVIGFLTLKADNLLALPHLLMILYLKNGFNNLFEFAQVTYLGATTIISVLMTVLIMGLTRRLNLKSHFNIKNIAIGLMALFCFVLSASLLVFKTSFNKNRTPFEKFLSIEYLTDKKYFYDFTKNLPNFRFRVLKNFAQKKEKTTVKSLEALSIGIKIKPTSPEFKEAFLELSKILLDSDIQQRIKSKDEFHYPEIILRKYIKYTNIVKNKAGNPILKRTAINHVNETYKNAELIMTNYTLGKMLYKNNKSYEQLLGDIRIAFII